MPEDFPEHANDTWQEIADRYHASFPVVKRWRDELGLQPKTFRKAVQKMDARTGRAIAVYQSLLQAGEENYISPQGIGVAARNYPRRTAGGYRWRYVK